jgi:superfamily II DNA or RNA helicase
MKTNYYTPFRISNAENVSPLSLKPPSKVGVSNEKWCKTMKKPATTTNSFNKKSYFANKNKNQNSTPNTNKTESSENVCTKEQKNTIRENAYIGQQGYTIPKSVLDASELEFLQKSLTLEPKKDGYCPTTALAPVSFPVFRENTSKIYIPQFYGIERYGMPKNKLSVGDAISVPFVKPIRDYQEDIIGVYLRHIGLLSPIEPLEPTPLSGGGILEVPCGRGKCLGIDTPILMYDGSSKVVQDVIVGDLLMGDDSTPRKVLSLARGKEMMYKIREKGIFSGEEYIVNESHILSLMQKRGPKTQIIDISVADYLRLPEHVQELLYGYRVPIEFQSREIPEGDPYDIGYSCWFIPVQYKCNSPKIQLEVLAGIIDAFGEFSQPGFIEIHCPNTFIIEDILFISRSLGFATYKKPIDPTKVFINIGSDSKKIPFRKNDHILKQMQQKTPAFTLEYDFEMEAIGIDDYYGFEIDGNRRFVLGDYTVTHNTVMALKIISVVSKKTLILVHKEFLMNQWIERIAEFMPSARIGKIQGPVFDIVDKDIVIGMIQSLYDRVFPLDAFSSFGLTIIDEVHRIGSEEFSKTLFKTISRCMLGISATVERKDGLTQLLYMYIGPKIYSEERKDDTVVEVRAIEFQHPQEEYNVVAYDYKGNVQYSTMLSKISNFVPRSEFLIRIMRDLLQENPHQQIMVLSHIRALLTFLYDHLSKHQIDVGYYIGGMKKEALEATEGKKVVLATYAMAAEALDIKTLNTLVMVSPKTDIIQSVGRILRMKADGKLIVDIVDTHEVFQNQWKKRRAYYKKCGYGIRFISSKNYVDMSASEIGKWKRVCSPSLVTCTNVDLEKEEGEIEKRICHIPISEYAFTEED